MSGAQRTMAWPLWFLAAPAFVAVWSGWVGLGQLCGFGVVQPLPGIWDGLRLDTSITLPIGVEAYAAYALRVWLAGDCAPRAVTFARRSTLAALSLGAFGQVVYHLLSAAGVAHAPWPVTALVAVLPVAVLGMGASLAHLVQQPRTSDSDGRPGAWPLSGKSEPPQDAKAVPKLRGAAGERGKRAGVAPSSATAARVAALMTNDRDLTTAALADRLGVSQRTARRHRASVLKELDTVGKEGAAA